MNNKSLYMVGGAALLASTALSTAAQAATIRGNTATLVGALAPTTTITALGLATQVFSATTTTANSVTVSGGGNTAGSIILIDTAPLFASFDLKLDISASTAAFGTSPTPTVIFYTQSTSNTLRQLPNASVGGCTVQAGSERISLLACNPTTADSSGSRIDAVGIRGLTYTSAAALRTAGTSVTLSGGIFQASTSSTFESITAAAVITSKSAAAATAVQAGSNVTIDASASTPFALLTSSGVTTTTAAVLGSVQYSSSLALGTDLSNVFSGIGSTVSTAEVKITHSVLTDTALTNITFNGTTKTSSDVVSGTVSFTVAGVSLTTSSIVANFNGTTAISASTGSPSATVTPTAGGLVVAAVPAFSGSLASFSRGGLSVELNSVLSGSMSASYISFLRIQNQSSVAGAATITVRNTSTGALIGSFVTASIPGGGMEQVDSSEIDTGLTGAGATPLTTDTYKVTVSGTFNGYVQHLLYNVSSQVFSDASGFRNGALTVDP
jgi:hypothetical protein